jgi:hypothetical protein
VKASCGGFPLRNRNPLEKIEIEESLFYRQQQRLRFIGGGIQMRKALSILWILCLVLSVCVITTLWAESGKPMGTVPNPAMKQTNTQNLPKVNKDAFSPSVTINKPGQNELWPAGKSYAVEWETKFLSPGSSGTVMLTVFVPGDSHCQPVTNIPLNGQINYMVPFASGQLGMNPQGKFMATISVKFIDKATNKEYQDGKMIGVQYP